MLEKLAGRLKWERTIQGIHIEIPARAGGVAVFLCFWLVFWSACGLFGTARVSAGDNIETGVIVIAVVWALAEVGVAIALIWSLTGRTTLTVDQAEMKIQRRILGVEWDTRSFSTRSVCNLRYVPAYWSSGFAGTEATNQYNQSRIRFEADDKTRSFASGVSDIEAFALIDRMLEVYNFPKDRALEYIGKP
jgi:hypothetical protein